MSSQRVAKVESLVLQLVAAELREHLGHDSARVTVTRIDAAPDLRSAIVWLGILGTDAQIEAIWKRVNGVRGALQAAVAHGVTMKYAPQLHLRQDTGGAYAAEIERLLRGTADL